MSIILVVRQHLVNDSRQQQNILITPVGAAARGEHWGRTSSLQLCTVVVVSIKEL